MRFFVQVLFLVLLSATSWAARWEVAVLFLGGQEDLEFQQDVDQNILELAKTKPGRQLRLSILRDFPGRRVQAHFGLETNALAGAGESLFFRSPLVKFPIPARLSQRPTTTSIFHEAQELRQFFSQAFPDPQARRLLIIYGHGEGHRGLRGVSLPQLQAALNWSLPARRQQKALDLLWFDSCFMANVQALYQLRHLSDLFLASQDSEFTAGLPFEILSDLELGPENTRQVAVELARRWVESYSTLQMGSQQNAVQISSATISVVESSQLENLILPLSKIAALLPSENLQKLLRSQVRLQMEDSRLVDLGRFLQTLFHVAKNKELKSAIVQLLKTLETKEMAAQQKTPKIRLTPSSSHSVFMFGYQAWGRGDERDPLWSAPHFLAGQNFEFRSGPHGRNWPSLRLDRPRDFQPFAPGLHVLDVIELDSRTGALLSEPKRFHRGSDVAQAFASRPGNPLLFTASTVGAGSRSERYTGLNITDPTLGLLGLEEIETELFQKTQWGRASF